MDLRQRKTGRIRGDDFRHRKREKERGKQHHHGKCNGDENVHESCPYEFVNGLFHGLSLLLKSFRSLYHVVGDCAIEFVNFKSEEREKTFASVKQKYLTPYLGRGILSNVV